MFQKAERKKARLRLALCGPAGSGKTYSALKIAQGLGGRIALIDTEGQMAIDVFYLTSAGGKLPAGVQEKLAQELSSDLASD